MFHKGKHDREKQLRFSIRKVSFGAASVAVAALFMFLGNGAVSAAEQGVPSTNGETLAPQPKDQNIQNGTYEGNTVANSPAATVETNTQPSTVENSPSPESAPQKVETLDKKELTDLIKEIDGKLSQGTYATKTEESVNNLRTVLEEARTALNNAKTQDELSQAQAKLVTATTKLQTKPEEKKEAPAVDTTNGKSTVGKTVANAEKSSDSNSIANSGSRDERHGKALDRSNPFRTDATTTDTHANNEAGVSIINGNFEEGTVKPTGNEKIVTNDASKVVGWHVVDPKQTEIPIVNATTRYVGSVDRNHPYGVLLAGYLRDHTNLNAGTEKVETIGKIYQDINVTPGSEVIVKYRTASFGAVGGFSTVKMTVKNPDTGEVYYSGMPNRQGGLSDGLAFINVPKNITKIRLEFEDADPYSRSSTGKDRFLSKNGTLLYPSGILTNVRVNTGAYVVAKENQTEYEVTSTSNNASTTSKDITVKVENKGWEATARGVKYKVDLPQGVTATYGGRTYSGTMEIDLGAIGNKTEKNFTYRLNIPAGTPSITNLVGKVEYKTWQNSEAVPYGETKTGVVLIPNQNVVLKMFKTELETAVAGAANLNQNEYTPDSWKKFQDEITKAREILNEEQKNVPVNQRKSQNEINNQVSLLRAKQNSLTVAATTTEKNNLSAKVAELTKASTVNKTPKSIDEYNKEFKKFEQDYNSIKTEVSNIIAKGDNATRTEVDAALSKVAEVRRKLDTAAGLLVNKGNKTELEKAVREESNVKGNFKYYNADKTKRDAYDSAITSGKDVINNPNATQAEVDAAKQAIEDAKGKLDGSETNKEALTAATSTEAESTKANNAKYYNGSEDKKAAYDKAVSDGKKILEKANATQAEVDAALRVITEAKNALDGKVTDKTQLTNTNNALNDLIQEDPTKGKTKATIDEYKKVKEESEKLLKEVKKVIDNKNASQIEVNKALEMAIKAKDSLENAKKSLLDAVEAREVVETLANEKIASIKADKKLSAQEKEKAIDRVERLKKKALEEIDKSKKQIEIDKALRTFLYQLDLESLVYDRPTFDLEAYIQASITGVVKVERGKAITQADIISKLSLPENVTVISIDLPDTNILGDKFAKVMLRLPDGTEVTVKVPVRVVASQNGDSKPETALPDYGRNNGSTNTEATVDKAKLEGAIRQLDELIIQESAKFDAETAQEATALLVEAKAVFANAKASQAEVDAMVKRIEDFMAKVASSTNHATSANDQADQTPAVAPATTQAANASQTASAQTNTRTVAKELPNTGTADSTVAMVAAAASALLGLGLAGRRKEDEEA